MRGVFLFFLFVSFFYYSTMNRSEWLSLEYNVSKPKRVTVMKPRKTVLCNSFWTGESLQRLTQLIGVYILSLSRFPRRSATLGGKEKRRVDEENLNKADEANDASSCLIEWLHDGMILDMLWLASFSFAMERRLISIEFHANRTDRPDDKQTLF